MKKKKAKKLVNDTWELMLTPWDNKPIPMVPTDKVIPKIKTLSKHTIIKRIEQISNNHWGKEVKSNASK